MKKFSGILLAAVAMTSLFAGCVREPEMLPSAEEQTVFFTAEPVETRTAFTDPTGDSYPVLWTENDQNVLIALNMDDKNKQTAAVTPSADFKTATFTATFSAEAESYTFYALSPASALLSVTAADGRLGVTVPSSQTPSAKSVDEAAQILVAQSSETSTMPEKVNFSFKHWTAYGKMSLTNLTLGEAKIEAVDLTAEEPWAGRWYYYFANGTSAVNSGSNTITVNTTTATDIWFACAPVDLSGKKLTVTVKTDKGTLTKEITMPADRKFESGKIARFNVDMEGISIQESQVYEMVTKAEDLLYNSKIVIAAASSAEGYNFAIGTTQNPNNRVAVEVTKSGTKVTDPSSSVEIFSLEAGSEAGTYAFKGQNGKYIYAPGGGNYLRSTDTKDAAASWTVTFKEGYVILESKVADKTQRFLRYNKSNSMFSCYAENSSVRDSVALYKLVGSGESSFPTEKKESGLWLEKTALTINVGESAEVAVDYDKMDAAYFTDGGSVTFSVDDATVATVDEDGMVMGVKAGTCTVTVTAPETTNYKEATKTCAITVKEASQGGKTIAELLALTPSTQGESTTESYDMNEATVVAMNGSNIVAKDATGLLLIYMSKHGAVVGDVITAAGKMQNYYGIAELSATTVTKVSSGAAVDHGTPVTFDEAAINAFLAAPVVQYCKISGTLPANSSDFMAVGSKTVALYDKTMYEGKYGMAADVYGYSIGSGSKGQVNFINTQIEVNASAPFLTVDATSKTWAADATDAFTVNVSVENGGSWTYTATGMDWATVTKSGNTLVVTPKAANTSSTANEGTVTLTNAADATKTATVSFKQSAKPSGDGYTKFSGDLVEGDYIIFYEGKAMNTTTASNRLQYKEVTPSSDMIAVSDATDEIVWHIAKSGDYWTIYNTSVGKYAVSTGTRNQATTSTTVDDKALWTVSGSETFEFVNKNNTANSINANLRNNGTYGFACYSTSTGGALTLYKKN